MTVVYNLICKEFNSIIPTFVNNGNNRSVKTDLSDYGLYAFPSNVKLCISDKDELEGGGWLR